VLFGIWKVVYDTQAPSPRVVMAAFGLALVAAAGVAILEHRISNRDRRSDRPGDERACESCLRVGPCLALTSR
jgi:heme A synthase